MNILIPDSWLREFVKTDAIPKQVAEALSLCSLSVNKVEKLTDGDSLYHIEVPPNRYDCLSIIGVAREVVAALPRFGHRASLTLPETQVPVSPKTSTCKLQVQVEPTLCPHFAAVVVEHVKIGPSPTIIRTRLEKTGIRALNNVIDVTNYLMLEKGQPMHAFGFDKVSGGKMILRESRAGEWLVTLDGIKRRLPSKSIVIGDGEKLIDLCGIMGGENSAITEQTQRVILFAQVYEPVHIRKTSMALPLRTEAAQRFEKGLDPEAVLPTLYQSIRMLQENAGAAVASQLYDINHQPFQPHRVTLRLERLNQYLGVILKPEEVSSILTSLGFQPASPLSTNHYPLITLSFAVPSWRDKDITIEEDLIEEVARIYGYHNLTITLPVGEPAAARTEPRFAYEHRLKFLLKDLGFTEVYTSSLVAKELAGDGETLRVTNPLGPETEYLKSDTLPTLISAAKENLARCEDIKLFEISNIYQPQPGHELPKEKCFLTIIFNPKSELDKTFLEVKGLVERIFHEFNLNHYTFKDFSTFPYDDEPALKKDTAFVIWPTMAIKTGKLLGVGGQTKEQGDFWVFKLHLEALWELAQPLTAFAPPPAHPPLIEEVSFYLPQKVTYAQAVETVQKAGGDLLKEVGLADYYTNETLQKKEQKSLTLKLIFADPQKTLGSKEIEPVREKIIKALREELKAEVRSK